MFIGGSHEAIVSHLVTEEHFPKVKAAVDDIVEKLETKRIRVESTLASPSDYGKSIQPNEGVCDHRFFSNLHVSLQIKAFGNFIMAMKSEEGVDGKYNRVASTLTQEMSGAFSYEKDRMTAFAAIIRELGELFYFQCHEGHGYRTDCTVVVHGRFPIANWEFKNEFFRNSTCPVAQNNAYFVHLKRRQKDRSPMFLVSVVGCHHLQVFGAVWNGQKCVCIDPLCSPLSLLFVPRDPTNSVSKLARLLSVLDKTLGELRDYYDKPLEHTDNRGPYWTYNGRLEYERNLTKSVHWLFEATLDGRQKIVVKFVRHHYGEAVHKFLAAKCCAPKLICCLTTRWVVCRGNGQVERMFYYSR